jgi:RNA polymerase sigma-B factor
MAATAHRLDRRRLIEEHLPLVRPLALRFVRHGEPLEDLIQVGCVGLIHAVDRYDPSLGHPFEAYAVPTITGEIRRYLRDSGAAVRLPRRLIEDHARVYRIRADLEASTGRTVCADELARAAGLPASVVASALDPPRAEPLGEDDGVAADPIPALQDRLSLAAALRALPLRERRIVALSFYGERSQRRIASELGLSQIHVSRLTRRALARMRAALEDGRPVAGPTGEA